MLKLMRGIRPWRIAFCRGAKVALELAGAIDRCGVEVGDHLVIDADQVSVSVTDPV